MTNEWNEYLAYTGKSVYTLELGAMLGISGKAVSKWERGLSRPCDEHLTRLVELIGLPVEAVLPAEEKGCVPENTFFSTVRTEFIRILATGAMIAARVCNLAGILCIKQGRVGSYSKGLTNLNLWRQYKHETYRNY